MLDWNVVVTVHEDAFTRACQIFSQFGEVRRSGYYNVLLMKVEDRSEFLDRLSTLVVNAPNLLKIVSRVMPAEMTFNFQDREGFECQSRATVLDWAPKLAGKSFHVRMHRRGFHQQMSSHDEEHFLDDVILQVLEESETPGRITFEDPDFIIDVDTVDNRAGLSIWTRDDLSRYPFLKLD